MRRSRSRSRERRSNRHVNIHRDRDRESYRGREYSPREESRRTDYREHDNSHSITNKNYYSDHKTTTSHSNPLDNKNLNNPRDKFQYLPPTTESLHAKKLAALDHEKFLIDRQREREGKPDVGHLIWPQTPPRAQYYYGNILIKDKDSNDDDDSIEEVESKSVEITNTNTTVEAHDESDSDDKFGPSLKIKKPSVTSKPSSHNLINLNSFTSDKSKYGGDMMPGEGSAMAGFVAQGQRIPRRGEIGLDSSEISRFESAGFVMSGSRHHMMNAVRMRKENQVISAEEKTMISQMAIEERIKREQEIVKTFKSMVDEKFKQNKK